MLFSKLENVEGVNALLEEQTIEFNPNLTIIYGTNGSGKSGYVRLFKQVFYSKAPEEILPNVRVSNSKPINAKFTFTSNNTDIPLLYADKDKAEFEQFSVFDGKGLLQQLAEKNEFDFRPAGLRFFSDYTEAIKRVEQKLNTEIQNKQSENDFGLWFEGESEIKNVVQNLSINTTIEDFQKYIPFSNEDKVEKEQIQKQYDELLLTLKGKDKEISNLENVKKLLGGNKKAIESINKYFTADYLAKITNEITDCINKEALAKEEGIENFSTDRIKGIGTKEWKSFIVSAEAFAKSQKSDGTNYPELCQQQLSEEARKLIGNYWIFVKSVAEENARKAQETLNKEKLAFEKLNFDLFHDENILTMWLSEKYPKVLEAFKQKLTEQKILSINIINDIRNKTANNRTELKINISEYGIIEQSIDDSIITLKGDEQYEAVEKLAKAKTLLEHKEKFNMHILKLENYVNNLIWNNKAGKANFAKRKITDTEKSLSDIYFNQKYIDAFNDECRKLNGNFGIDVNHKGSAGKSYRQLKLMGRTPNSILSEGEQKVIALADFIAEMQLSEVNRGIIFDDPVTSLDDFRKSEIAKRLVQESCYKQTIIFTHDLVFVSALIGNCSDLKVKFTCHWVENRDGKPGQVWLNNSPSYEKEYRNAEPAKKYYAEAKKDECPPAQREFLLKSGFTALRTCYEVLVINDLFKNVVQRFNERVSIDSLSNVYFDTELIAELQDSFDQCCRYMEGHTHSDKYAYKKPEPHNLNEEIVRYEAIRSKIKKYKKPDQ
ncbi:MAG: AAA family ATPase [Candidatus Methanofastidiosum sp.]|nr:AAA family ATPase [Methanofastidiosum sp.]